MRYVKILDNIYFDLEHDNYEWINKWFDFILNMADEQLYFLKPKLRLLEDKINFYNLANDQYIEALKRLLYDMKNLDDEDSEDYKIRALGALN